MHGPRGDPLGELEDREGERVDREDARAVEPDLAEAREPCRDSVREAAVAVHSGELERGGRERERGERNGRDPAARVPLGDEQAVRTRLVQRRVRKAEPEEHQGARPEARLLRQGGGGGEPGGGARPGEDEPRAVEQGGRTGRRENEREPGEQGRRIALVFPDERGRPEDRETRGRVEQRSRAA